MLIVMIKIIKSTNNNNNKNDDTNDDNEDNNNNCNNNNDNNSLKKVWLMLSTEDCKILLWGHLVYPLAVFIQEPLFVNEKYCFSG